MRLNLHKHNLIFYAVGMFLLLTAGPVFAHEIFVSINGADSSGSGSLSQPYRKISYAVGKALTGDTITVMPGTYADGQTYLYKGVYLRSQKGIDSTILSGIGIVFFMDNYSSNCVVDGFTIRDAKHGIYIIYGSPAITIKNNLFTHCDADTAGGAIYLLDSRSIIHDNLFLMNSAVDSGGAMVVIRSSPQIYNNIFDGNLVTMEGAEGGALLVSGNLQALPPESTHVVIQNNIFRNNTAYFGAAMSAKSSRLFLYNNLFHNNQAVSQGGALFVDYSYNPYIYNNIFLYNSPQGIYVNDWTISYCDNNDYYGNTPTNGCDGCPTPQETYYLDPRFVDFTGHDYHLTDASGLINKGRTGLEAMLSFDFDGQKRMLAGYVDIGPDEYADCTIGGNFATLDGTDSCPGLIVNFSALSLTGYIDSMDWDFGDGVHDYNVLAPSHGYEDTGTFAVTLTISTPCTTVAISKPSLIHIMNEPQADFSAETRSGCVPLSVPFHDNSLNPVSSRLWTFGDGDSSRLANPTHVYDVPGDYTVFLLTVNACGRDSITKASHIEALAGAVAKFGALPLAGSAPLGVNFADSSDYIPISWNWQFGDGGTDIEKNPFHRYLIPGIFDIRLICANACETPDTSLREDYVRVYGFEVQNYHTSSSDKYNFRYDLFVDSVYGLFNRPVSLRASVLNNPRRGRVDLVYRDSTLDLFDSTYLLAALSKDVPRGEYNIVVTGTGSGGAPIDMLQLLFNSTADPIITVTPQTLDFGEVPEDSVKTLAVRIQNSSLFIDDLTLMVNSIAAEPAIFSAQDPGQFILLSDGYRNINISFAPDGLGEFSGNVTILSDDPAFPQLLIPVVGQGVLERTPPIVDSTRPANLEKEYAVTDSIKIIFSEMVDFSGLALSSPTPVFASDPMVAFSTKLNRALVGAISQNEQGNELIFKPTNGFMAEDSILVTVNGNLRDLAGNSLDGNGNGVGEGSPLDNYIFSFTTGLAVYPGDGNNDGIVDEIDVLPLGMFWDLTGFARGSIPLWGRQASKKWATAQAAYADCNGDGRVDGADLLVIGANWGRVHQAEGAPIVFTEAQLEAARSGFDALYQVIGNLGFGENGAQIQNVLGNYISNPAELKSFCLGRNFPNPFNPITTIDYILPRSCQVTIEVYNVLGQKVKSLANGLLPAGLGSVVWDGTDNDGTPVPSGVYFYRMTAEDFNEVRKMLLIR